MFEKFTLCNYWMNNACLETHSFRHLLAQCSQSDRESLKGFTSSFGKYVCTKTRYTNCWGNGVVPTDMFSEEMKNYFWGITQSTEFSLVEIPQFLSHFRINHRTRS
eukprot:TRINITY_DN5990_c0_g2_i1.p1 TRINITY_DN5990_c0_g2~~TRINITY_DN5990_c0_g2_i1.p1  ORF type:complete len:106 (-),score=1.27 TRINITY_DN5990_c0_g2_i1:12-329(-)